jgi:NAD(P)-dependent dehydrogenase (short-subunit alcohol dehydrogenase family)
VIKQIQTLNPSVKTFFFPIDLTDAASIRSAVERLLSHPEIKNIDVLINNAGVLGVPYTPIDAFKDEKGASVELHFAANHLGPFLLTVLLMQRIRNSGPGARIVNVSAGAYIFSEVKFDDLNFSVGAIAILCDASR